MKTSVTSMETTTKPHKHSRRNVLRAWAGRTYITNPAVEEIDLQLENHRTLKA
jgi:hypothetical protein